MQLPFPRKKNGRLRARFVCPSRGLVPLLSTCYPTFLGIATQHFFNTLRLDKIVAK
jgi:hypothetical protein